MRLSSWFSSWPEGGGWKGDHRCCRRWERALYLAVSGDLPEPTARAFSRHLPKCTGCREELDRCIALRARSLSLRMPPRRSLWPAILGTVHSAEYSTEFSPLFPPEGTKEGTAEGTLLSPLPVFPGRVRGEGGGAVRPLLRAFSGPRAWPARIAALVLLGWCSWLSVMSFHEETDSRSTLSSRKVLEARWTAQWDDFVSGETRGEINIDPFASEIPNPDIIDF